MRFVDIQWGRIKMAIAVMLVLYGVGQGMMVWASVRSGWGRLAKHYQTDVISTAPGRRLPGAVKMGELRFGVRTVAAYQSADRLVIRGRSVPLALGFLHFPDLEIPLERIEPVGSGGSWIDCGEEGKVYFEMQLP